jgi:opacity protein-like surface antigen
MVMSGERAQYRRRVACILAVAIGVTSLFSAVASAQTGENVPDANQKTGPDFPSHKFSGLMFGDYYWYYKWHQDQISDSDPTSVEGQNGFWFRRLYFTYDYNYSERFTTRLRLEMNSNGQFAGGDLEPYVKDAYLKWTFTGKQQLTLGIQPSLTFDWFDVFWGLRHIEKTPADLYRIDSSRDFGVTVNGSLPIGGLSYAAQFGGESGSGSEDNQGKILRTEARFAPDAGVVLEGFYSFGSRGPDEDRHTAQGVAGFRNNIGRLAAQYLWQRRRSGLAPNQTIAIWSGFGVWDVRPKKADLFLRVDNVRGHLGDVETGLPGADGIDYWLLSPSAPFTTWIVGGEWYLQPNVRLSPNLETARYTHDPDPVNFPGRRQDSILRLTFFWTF